MEGSDGGSIFLQVLQFRALTLVHVYIHTQYFLKYSYYVYKIYNNKLNMYIHVHVSVHQFWLYYMCGECQCRMTSTICPLNLAFEIYQKNKWHLKLKNSTPCPVKHQKDSRLFFTIHTIPPPHK